MRVTFIHGASNPFYSGRHYDNTYYEFLVRAMRDNPDIDRYDVMPIESEYDASRLKGKTDAVVLTAFDAGTPEIRGLRELDVPVVSVAADFHSAKRNALQEKYDKMGIGCVFSFNYESYFYRYVPNHIRFKTIRWGVEPKHYADLPHFGERIHDKILLTGATERRANAIYRAGSWCLRYAIDVIWNPQRHTPLKRRVLYPRRTLQYHYKLRSDCKKLQYVVHDVTMQGNESGAYQRLLSKYRAAIAATTWFATIKYAEIPACGCLTFMEITDRNHAADWGYEDGKTCIAINEDNYEQRFAEYLNDPDSERYERIADAGRRHAVQNFNNDRAAATLVSLIREMS